MKNHPDKGMFVLTVANWIFFQAGGGGVVSKTDG